MNINHLTNSIESPKLNWRGLFYFSGGLSKHQWIVLIIIMIALLLIAFLIGKHIGRKWGNIEKEKHKFYDSIPDPADMKTSTSYSQEQKPNSQKKWYE